MKLVNRLEQRLGRYAIPNVALWLCAAQALGFLIGAAKPQALEAMVLRGEQVLQGEVWRLFSFLLRPVFVPTQRHGLDVVGQILAIQLLYMMGMALERHWGAFRLDLFCLSGFVATVAVAFVARHTPVNNWFLFGSILAAFAYLYPDFVIWFYFIVPIRIKYFAMLEWLLATGILILWDDWAMRLAVLASAANFLLFFAKDLAGTVKRAAHRMRTKVDQIEARGAREDAFHTCAVCGITDKTHPNMEFRYCPQCKGTPGFCMDHIHDHEHVTE